MVTRQRDSSLAIRLCFTSRVKVTNPFETQAIGTRVKEKVCKWFLAQNQMIWWRHVWWRVSTIHCSWRHALHKDDSVLTYNASIGEHHYIHWWDVYVNALTLLPPFGGGTTNALKHAGNEPQAVPELSNNNTGNGFFFAFPGTRMGIWDESCSSCLQSARSWSAGGPLCRSPCWGHLQSHLEFPAYASGAYTVG